MLASGRLLSRALATRASLSGVLSNLCQKSRAMNAALHLRLHLSCKTRGIYGALGRTRTCDLLIRRPNRAVLCGSLKCVKGDSWDFERLEASVCSILFPSYFRQLARCAF